MVPECTHIKTTDGKCGSPALRGELFCYYHSPNSKRPARQPVLLLNELSNFKDHGSIQRAVTAIALAAAETASTLGGQASSSTLCRSLPATRNRWKPTPTNPQSIENAEAVSKFRVFNTLHGRPVVNQRQSKTLLTGDGMPEMVGSVLLESPFTCSAG